VIFWPPWMGSRLMAVTPLGSGRSHAIRKRSSGPHRFKALVDGDVLAFSGITRSTALSTRIIGNAIARASDNVTAVSERFELGDQSRESQALRHGGFGTRLVPEFMHIHAPIRAGSLFSGALRS
jgi:hypothetical protein